MFIRKHGRRYLILHSYRDGRGKVCQRRLGHFMDAAGLERELAELPKSCPELAGTLPRLRSQAEAMFTNTPIKVSQRSGRIKQIARLLSTYLAEESDPEVWREVSRELHELRAKLPASESANEVESGRIRLSPRRRRFDSSDVNARPYLESLDKLADTLTQEDRLEECAQALKERVERCPTGDSRLAYGAVLQKLDRLPEALEQYDRVAMSDAYRHYNCASALWRQGLTEKALVQLLQGLTRNSDVIDALKRMQKGLSIVRGGEYWQRYGDLWPLEARRFAVKICSEHLVRHQLGAMFDKRIVARQLISAHSRIWLIKIGLED